MVNNWWKYIQFRLFPPTCILCHRPGAEGLDLCPDCRRGLPSPAAACARCAEPLTGTASALICGRCQRRPPAFDGAHTLYLYRPPVDRLILDLKHHRRLAQARLLGQLLAVAAADWPACDLLVPVPLHPRRQWRRGFNQSLEIARFAARGLKLPLDSSHCRRQRRTDTQADLSARARRANVRGAFRAEGDWAGLRVAIIDDVMTTGATADALARALKARGAAEVRVWVCARAGMHG
ncbi:ComF family protein [Thiohalobacter thiocyanaticus]|uniref:ComF family protein n=1 Tax=Thiohalobacter thiocyanaticus TaxID=585455 RepID=A0A426QK08_9GAMM|nr:ComF family protein [Thiohalobacter thiocyanaticus]RRQ22104.1 ComF family protein [Thiohalobacter thiocyanaticus]